MFYLFDALLLLPVLFLVALRYTDKKTKSVILSVFATAFGIFLVRRLTTSAVGVLVVITTFALMFAAKKAYRLFLKNEYIVLSVDIENNKCVVSDGRNIFTLNSEATAACLPGEIIRIDTKSD